MKSKINTSIFHCIIGLIFSSFACQSNAAEKAPPMTTAQAASIWARQGLARQGMFQTPTKPQTWPNASGVHVLADGGDQRGKNALVKKHLQEIHVSNVPNFHGWTLTKFVDYIHRQGANVVVDVNINADYLRILRKMNNERLLTDWPIDLSDTSNPTIELGSDGIIRPMPQTGRALPKLDPDLVIFSSDFQFRGEMSLADILRNAVPQFETPLKHEIRNGMVYIMPSTEEQRQESRFGTFFARINPFRLPGYGIGNTPAPSVGFAPGFGPTPAKVYPRPQPAPPVTPGTGGGITINIIQKP